MSRKVEWWYENHVYMVNIYFSANENKSATDKNNPRNFGQLSFYMLFYTNNMSQKWVKSKVEVLVLYCVHLLLLEVLRSNYS